MDETISTLQEQITTVSAQLTGLKESAIEAKLSGERVKEVEKQFADLKTTFVRLETTLKNLMWFGAVLGAILLAGSSYTAIVSVPAAAKKALEDSAVKKTVEDLNAAKVETAKSLSDVKANSEIAARFVKNLNDGRIELKSACRSQNDDNYRTPPPLCERGFQDSKLILDLTYSGGAHGRGNVCRICYRLGTN